jgi:hypothetical protein
MALLGIFGRPFIDLEPHLDLSTLGALHDEICLAFAEVPADYTGGSHRSMGIMPASRKDEALVDYGEVIRGMSDVEFLTFRSLSDNPDAIDPHKRHELTYGEERQVPLSRRQMLWLKVRFGVYFPWKAYVELIPNERWTDKATSEGKTFTRRARAFFPKTIAFIESLPFRHVGRANVMGLEAHDHGTAHRDGEPEEQTSPDHFITICPTKNKRLFVWDEASKTKTHILSRAYWFNDFDYHGVDADPFFRYSLRVDGVFRDDFLERLQKA